MLFEILALISIVSICFIYFGLGDDELGKRPPFLLSAGILLIITGVVLAGTGIEITSAFTNTTGYTNATNATFTQVVSNSTEQILFTEIGIADDPSILILSLMYILIGLFTSFMGYLAYITPKEKAYESDMDAEGI